MCPNPQETVDLVTFTEEILNKELYFLCSERERESSLQAMQCAPIICKLPLNFHKLGTAIVLIKNSSWYKTKIVF